MSWKETFNIKESNPLRWNKVKLKSEPLEGETNSGKVKYTIRFQGVNADFDDDANVSLIEESPGVLYNFSKSTLKKLCAAIDPDANPFNAIMKALKEETEFYVKFHIDDNGYLKLEDAKSSLTEEDKMNEAITEADSGSTEEEGELPF